MLPGCKCCAYRDDDCHMLLASLITAQALPQAVDHTITRRINSCANATLSQHKRSHRLLKHKRSHRLLSSCSSAVSRGCFCAHLVLLGECMTIVDAPLLRSWNDFSSIDCKSSICFCILADCSITAQQHKSEHVDSQARCYCRVPYVRTAATVSDGGRWLSRICGVVIECGVLIECKKACCTAAVLLLHVSAGPPSTLSCIVAVTLAVLPQSLCSHEQSASAQTLCSLLH